MKRNMDLIRALLLRLEAEPVLAGRRSIFRWGDSFFSFQEYSQDDAIEHFRLLLENGYISGPPPEEQGTNFFIVTGLSWKGHELIDTIRSPEIWKRTKAGAEKIGGLGIDLILELAKAEGKTFLSKHLGITF